MGLPWDFHGTSPKLNLFVYWTLRKKSGLDACIAPTTPAGRPILLLLAALAVALPGASAQPPAPPDLVLAHGVILTVDPHETVAQALAIRAGRIVAVGSDPQILALAGPRTQVIDLHGRTATPGLIDTHAHYAESGAGILLNVGLSDATSIAEVVRRVQARARTARPGEWIQGDGWDDGKFAEHRPIAAADLDAAAPNNPVWLRNTTGHMSIANSYGLRLAHITAATPDPPQGTIDRDPTGAPAGILREHAQLLVSKLIPPPTPEQIKQGILHAIEELHREGMTAIKDIGTPAIWDAYSSLLAEGKLTERVCMLWRAGPTLDSAQKTLAHIQQHPHPPHSLGGARLLSCGAKLFMDGAVASRTAWVYQPWYKNTTEIDANNFGYPTTDPEVYRQQVRLFHQAGVTVGTHAIGDRAIDWVVDTYALVLKEKPTPGLRHSIIHASMPTPHAIEIMAALQNQYDAGYPEVQPAFLWWLANSLTANLGPDRLARMKPLHTFLEQNVRWSGGSDSPVVPFAARFGLWASVERETPDGAHPFGMSEAVDIHAALRSYTAWAAPMLFLEDQIGTLGPGKHADIAIWDRNLYTIPSEALKDLHCEMTLLDGKIVYQDSHSPIAIERTQRPKRTQSQEPSL
jgi:predicted amidohydrolase YtcJ